MNAIFAVLLDGVAQLEYDRDRPLSEYQIGYLESMNRKMDQGIDMDGTMVSQPGLELKTRFVSANLLNAMHSGNEGMTSALCTWLAHHHPDLKQLKFTEEEGKVTIELVYDEDYVKQVAVNFSGLEQ